MKADFTAPFIETQFEQFAKLITNGQGSKALMEMNPQLFVQVSQAFAVAFLRGFKFGEHVGMHEAADVREEIGEDLRNEAQYISKRSREFAAILGAPTRNTREMDAPGN